MTAATTVAAQIAAIEACIGRVEVRGERVAYDGPEPVEERVPDWDADHRALAEENAQERSRRWWER